MADLDCPPFCINLKIINEWSWLFIYLHLSQNNYAWSGYSFTCIKLKATVDSACIDLEAIIDIKIFVIYIQSNQWKNWIIYLFIYRDLEANMDVQNIHYCPRISRNYRWTFYYCFEICASEWIFRSSMVVLRFIQIDE